MAEKKAKLVDGLEVTTKRDGFRRGGRAWNGTTKVAVSEFSKDQLAQIKAEHGRMLVVRECEVEEAAKAEDGQAGK